MTKLMVDLNLMFDELATAIRPLVNPELLSEAAHLEEKTEDELWAVIIEGLRSTFEDSLKASQAYEFANILMQGMTERNERLRKIAEIKANGPSIGGLMELLKMMGGDD
jgi:hypothetical protein